MYIYFIRNNLYSDNINVKLLLCILSKQKKFLGLLEKKVFQVINPKDVSISIQVFILWFIDKIKNANINKLFEKSYLVMQAYNNFNKNLILTQLPTI